MLLPIPHREDPERYTALCAVSSPFVELTRADGLDVCMQYPLKGLACGIPCCYVRQEVNERLLEAQNRLPNGWRLRIWDAWRPFALQQELYDRYSQQLLQQVHLETAPQEQQRRLLDKFISFPENDRTVPPVHTTGGAVDVTLIDAAGKELNMGTAFDAFGDEAMTNYYETIGNAEEVACHRRILYSCMTAAGFTNLPSEWWHFDYGDRFWAYYNHTPALYSGAFTIEEVK